MTNEIKVEMKPIKTEKKEEGKIGIDTCGMCGEKNTLFNLGGIDNQETWKCKKCDAEHLMRYPDSYRGGELKEDMIFVIMY
jgi:transposase-like protein